MNNNRFQEYNLSSWLALAFLQLLQIVEAGTGSIESEALKNEDRSRKHPTSKTEQPKVENEAPETREQNTWNSKAKQPVSRPTQGIFKFPRCTWIGSYPSTSNSIKNKQTIKMQARTLTGSSGSRIENEDQSSPGRF